MHDELLTTLGNGSVHWFRDWPAADVPTHAAGVYTVWEGETLVYVGMSGRSIMADTPHRRTPLGLFTRLASHAGGRRSGDQFCVYVADRLLLPTLSAGQLREIADGTLSMDSLVRAFIHDRLSYRFAVVPDGATAFQVENLVKRGALGTRPVLNPGTGALAPAQ